MIDAGQLSAGELRALLHFYADAGVDFMLEDAPVDRIAQFEEQRATRAAVTQADERTATAGKAPARQVAQTPAPMRPAQALAVPDEDVVNAAKKIASDAADLAELRAAIASFEGCNLRSSARNTVFPEIAGQKPILVLGAMPSADDDREGVAFSGRYGDLLERMLAAIQIDKSEVTLAHCLPWRAPGDRSPTPTEIEICRPFAEKLIQFANPKAILLLGNVATRFFFGTSVNIHGVRGQWQEIRIGQTAIPTLPTLHPQDMIAAPAGKRLVWADLLAFEDFLSN